MKVFKLLFASAVIAAGSLVSSCSSKNPASPAGSMATIYLNYYKSGSYAQTDAYIYEDGILNHIVMCLPSSSGYIKDTMTAKEGSWLRAEWKRSDVPSSTMTADTTAVNGILWNFGN